MSGVLKIDRAETAEELTAVLEQQQRSSQRREGQVLWWLKTGQAKRVEQLAQLSGCHHTTVSRWLSQYRQRGREALVKVASRSGRPRAISDAVLAALERNLQGSEGLSSDGALQQWLAAVRGQPVPYKTVHQTVPYQLKVPRPMSKQPAPGADESFQQTLQPS